MSEGSTPKPKRRRSLLGRLFKLVSIGFVVLVAGLSVGLWWAYQHRVKLTNQILQNLEPVIAHAGAFELDRDGHIEVKDFVLGSAENDKVVQLPSIKAKVTWQALARGEIESLTLDHPDLDFTEGMLAELLKTSTEAPASADRAAFKQGFKIHRLDIEKATVSYLEKDGSTVDLVVTCHASDIALSETGQLSLGDQELIIEDGGVSHQKIDDTPLAVKRLHMKGRLRDGFVELEEFVCDEPAFHLRPELVSLFMPKGPHRAQTADTSDEESPIKGLRIKRAVIRDFELNAHGFGPENPSSLIMADAGGTITYEAEGVEWPFDGEPTVTSQQFRLKDLDVHPPTGDSHLRCKDAFVALARSGRDQPWHIEKCNVDALDVNWTAELRHWLVPPADKDEPFVGPPAPVNSTPWSLAVKQASLNDASVRIADPEVMSFEFNTKGEMEFADLTVDNTGWHSESEQWLKLNTTSCRFPPEYCLGTNTPFLELPAGELRIIPDAWSEHKMAQRLVLTKPTIRLRGNTPWMGSAFVGPPLEAPEAAAPEEEATPWWKQLQFEELSIHHAKLDLITEDAKPLDARAGLTVTTQAIPNGNMHRIALENIEVRLPTLSKFPSPVMLAEKLELTAQVPEMWSREHLEELYLHGLRLSAGQALMKYFEQPKAARIDEPADNEKPAAVAAKLSNWDCGYLGVDGGIVTLENVVPGIPSVRFDVNFDVEDAPLTPEGLARNVAPQQVVIGHLKIPSPYEPLRSVAELDDVYIDFSLEGLMRKEIDKVEMNSPTLYVGEDLFWYVDFYRKYAVGGTVPPHAPAFVSSHTDDEEFVVAGAVVESEPALSEAPWSVRTLAVDGGKLVLAPKGTPLPGFRTPFPFSFTSELKRGTLEADFEIPPDTYIYEDLKLQFEGMKGRVQFNLPVKGKDNNLTEVFEVDRIRWKQMHVENAHMSVTYDANGIYGKFDGAAYEGFVNGQFDIYLDDNFTWDGWISGTNVQLHEITQKLMPGYFLMDGKVEASIVAAGDKNEVYQADGKFLNHTPGKFSIAAMNELLASLPKDWQPLQKQMTQIGLETLRDFDYDQTVGNFRFYGREGKGSLTFKGPAGSRNFEVNVFDHRWKNDDEKPTTVASGTQP